MRVKEILNPLKKFKVEDDDIEIAEDQIRELYEMRFERVLKIITQDMMEGVLKERAEHLLREGKSWWKKLDG